MPLQEQNSRALWLTSFRVSIPSSEMQLKAGGGGSGKDLSGVFHVSFTNHEQWMHQVFIRLLGLIWFGMCLPMLVVLGPWCPLCRGFVSPSNTGIGMLLKSGSSLTHPILLFYLSLSLFDGRSCPHWLSSSPTHFMVNLNICPLSTKPKPMTLKTPERFYANIAFCPPFCCV